MAPRRSRTAATFVLVPGAGGLASYWHRLVPELARRGHAAVAVDLSADDDGAGLHAYAEAIVRAAGDREHIALVAQSMGALSAPLACEPLGAELLVLLNAMIPLPGESGGAWWANTAQAQARAARAARERRSVTDDVDVLEDFFHDVPDPVVTHALQQSRAQSDRPFAEPFPLAVWPDVPTRVLAGSDDRFFPPDFQRRVAESRLGITPDEMPGGHLLALSRPAELARRLDAYWRELAPPRVTALARRGQAPGT
jgi:pimeloyl-ACP methyl ester carboxylesterase